MTLLNQIFRFRFFVWFIKICVTVFLFYYLYKNIFSTHFYESLITYYSLIFSNYFVLVFLGLGTLTIVSIEALKWKTVLKDKEILSWKSAVSSVLLGYTFSMFTPNRIGDYAGRVLYLQKTEKWNGVSLSLLCSYSQFASLLILGILGGVTYVLCFISITFYLTILLLSTALVAIGLVLFIYFKTGYFIRKRIVNNAPKRWRNCIIVFSTAPKKQLAYLLFLSIIKFMITYLQYATLLTCCQVKFNIVIGFMLMMLQFIIQACVPSFAIAELGVRGSIAVLVWNKTIAHADILVFATSMLWLFNLMLPSILGIILFWFFRFNKKKLIPIL